MNRELCLYLALLFAVITTSFCEEGNFERGSCDWSDRKFKRVYSVIQRLRAGIVCDLHKDEKGFIWNINIFHKVSPQRRH